MTRPNSYPAEIERMHPRQRELMRVIYVSAGATVREIHSQIPDPPASVCGLRTQLNRLVRKGLLRARRSGRHSEVLYLPARSDAAIQLRAFHRIARDHFGGSKARTIEVLSHLAIDEKRAQLII